MRSGDLVVQAGLTAVIVICATIAAVISVGNEPVLSGDALAGIYLAAVGYIFGIVPGQIAQRNGRKALEAAAEVVAPTPAEKS